MQTLPTWHPDASQQKILDLKSGKHLVLAPPGCGKTQILAERISLALAEGVKPEDMLCLTFTNRAARGMRERINERVGEKETENVFVGNVHRFCSRFLFANGIVPAESAIIDDDTMDSILARYLNEDEDLVKRDFRRKRAHAQIMFFSHLMYDIIHGVSKELRIHPECVTPEDVATLKAIAKATDRPFDAALMIDVYDHTDYYLDLINQPVFPVALKHQAEQSLMKMRYAHAYVAYKNQNNLLDFEDLLQLTYSALKDNPSFKRYPWIQVDEVQDLNRLQLAIIEELETPPPAPPLQGGVEHTLNAECGERYVQCEGRGQDSGEAISTQADTSPLPEGEGPGVGSPLHHIPLRSATPMVYPLMKKNLLENRREPTDGEKALWSLLKNDSVGVRFRRQFAIGDYIVDFICLPSGIVIEVDGGYHDTKEQKEYDEQRTKVLESYGCVVIRFRNEAVIGNPDGVMEKIKEVVKERKGETPPPAPPLQGGGKHTVNAECGKRYVQCEGRGQDSGEAISTQADASPLPEGEGPGVGSVAMSPGVGSVSLPLFLFFGDEQQAIFSFMGAKLATLNKLKEECKGNIHHLDVNHRQPAQIVQMLNEYAIANLHSDPALLPAPMDVDDKDRKKVELRICATENIWAEYKSVAKRTKKLVEENPADTTAIIVNSNRDADEVSEALTQAKLPHFKISGTDLFSTPEVKLLIAHLSVLNNELNSLAWAQILQGMKVCATAASARQFVHRLRTVALAPTDLLHEDRPYLQQFLRTYEESDLIVFDTETTGLNVFEDDIIQIAAERISHGRSVAKFSVYLQSNRPIPKMLGDIENPIIEERKHNELLTPAEGLRAFLDFAGDCPLLAHNATFDYHIMDFCLKRYLPDVQWQAVHPVCFDSLKLIRLLRPDLKVYKLKALLAELGLEGENSHLADDDVNATISLVNYCFAQGKEKETQQQTFLQQTTTVRYADRLCRNYAEYYFSSWNKLYLRKVDVEGMPALVEELQHFYHSLEEARWIRPIEKVDYLFRFLSADVIHQAEEPSLIEQLDHHIMEISTFKEADLCGSNTMEDKVFVSTIHKAKGLEFDNVIVFDAVDGRIPNYHNENNQRLMEEDARKLYVALSRSKQRIFVYYSKNPPTTNISRTQKLSRFMEPVRKYFAL